jgi:hypothetical protein
VGGPGQCKLGQLPRRFAGENRPLLSGKVVKLYPRGDFVVSQMEINKIDQSARESALSKISQKPTSGVSWLRSSRNYSVLGS